MEKLVSLGMAKFLIWEDRTNLMLSYLESLDILFFFNQLHQIYGITVLEIFHVVKYLV